MPERPFLTAEWRDLLLLNFAVPTSVIAQLAPPGTEPDTHDGQAYVSIVGFRFQNVRVMGLRPLGHTQFPEINLRYYVRRIVGSEVRRGVVFVREIVPRRAVTLIANWLYHENYITRPMRSELRMAGATLAPGDTVEYAWQSRPRRSRLSAPFSIPLPFRSKIRRGGEGAGEGSVAHAPTTRWNRLAARIAAPLALPPPESLEAFFVEHYWGYAAGRDGKTREYRVAHDPWRVAIADDIAWDCDLPATFNSPFDEYLAAPPTSAIFAAGSSVQVFHGRRILF